MIKLGFLSSINYMENILLFSNISNREKKHNTQAIKQIFYCTIKLLVKCLKNYLTINLWVILRISPNWLLDGLEKYTLASVLSTFEPYCLSDMISGLRKASYSPTTIIIINPDTDIGKNCLSYFKKTCIWVHFCLLSCLVPE